MTLEQKKTEAIEALTSYLEHATALRRRLMKASASNDYPPDIAGLPNSYADADILNASRALCALTQEWRPF